MTDLEKVRQWVKGFGGLPDNFQIDFTNEIPQNAGLFPTGQMELSRMGDLLGNTWIINQYNFGLYAVFDKPDDIDEISAQNAEWVMNFQKWVQERSARGAAPTFGNYNTDEEIIKAQNGLFYGSKADGVGIYMVSLTATFTNYYEEAI